MIVEGLITVCPYTFHGAGMYDDDVLVAPLAVLITTFCCMIKPSVDWYFIDLICSIHRTIIPICSHFGLTAGPMFVCIFGVGLDGIDCVKGMGSGGIPISIGSCLVCLSFFFSPCELRNFAFPIAADRAEK